MIVINFHLYGMKNITFQHFKNVSSNCRSYRAICRKRQKKQFFKRAV